MAGFFDDTENTTSPVAKSFFDDTEAKPIPARTVGSTLKDLAISTGRGALEIPGMITGLADLPFALTTGTRPFDTAANYIGEKTGIQPTKLANKLTEDYSPVQKQSATDIQKVWDDPNTNALDVAKAYITHPGYVANQVFESAPSMLAGGVASKGIMGAGKLVTLAVPAIEGAVERTVARQGAGVLERKLADRAIAKLGIDATPEAIAAAQEGAYKSAAAIAGGSGEGIVQAGQAMDQSTGTDQRKNAIAALGSGLIDAVISTGAGKVAQHLGFETAETAMAKSFNNQVQHEVETGLAKYGTLGKMFGGGFAEGILQEFPQSAQEQIFQNYADGKPLWDGVNRAAVEGALAGFVMGAGANVIHGKEGNIKTPEEIELDRRAGNILAQDKDKVDQSIQTLNDNIAANNDLLNDPQKFDAKVRADNVDPTELAKQLVKDTNGYKSLLDKINQRIADQDKNAQAEKQAAYDKLSPEDKAAKDVVDKLNAQRIADAQKINTDLDAFKTQEALLLDQYKQEQDPEKKKVIEENVFALRKEKNALLDKQTQQAQQLTQEFATAKTSDEIREDRQKELEETFGTANRTFPSDKDAAESAKVIENEIVPKTIADYANQIITNKTQERNSNQVIPRTPEEEHNLRQIEDYVNYTKTYINNSFTPKEQSVIEDYWQGVKKELDQHNEKMTPGTEAFMRQKFFETKLGEIENNVKQDAKTISESNKKVTIPLAEQNKRQAWFQKTAKELGDFAKTNNQAITPEVPRNLPGGIQDSFTNEPQVHEGPQSQDAESYTKDESGKELIGFHGTDAKPFESFDNNKIQTFEHGWSGAGHYFTLKKDYAQGYADAAENVTGKPGRVAEARFSFKNPLYKTSPEYKQILKNAIGKTSILNKEDGIKATEAFKAAGYDAVIDGRSLDNALEINVFDSKNIHTVNGQTHFELNTNEQNKTQAKQETNLGAVLNQVKSADGLTGQLANFLSDFITASKLNIKVIIDPTVKSASYVGGKVNTITLRDPSQLTSSIHEITHAVTVREMKANPAIREQVKLLMKKVENKAIKEALITPAQVALLRTETTSRGYKENLSENIKFENVAYGLLNENEFLAQAMGSEQFQQLLKATTIADKGMLRNAWDAFVEVVMKALGIKGASKNAFGEALSIIAKLASQENVNQNDQAIHESLQVEQRLPQSEYDEVYAHKNDLLKNIAQQARIKYHQIKLLTDKAIGSISTRLKNVDSELSEHLRWLDFKTNQRVIDILETAKPLLDSTKIMSAEDKSAWNWARLNSDQGKIEQLAQKYNLTNDQTLLREKLNQIRQDAIEVGYDVGFVDEYWPRVIKDQEGFLQATQEISHRPVFTEAIKAQADKLGLTQKEFERNFPEVKADIISNLILGKNYGIGGPGNIQARVFDTIPKEYASFYMNADAALMQYVYSMTKKIEARKFFGKVPERISGLKSSMKQKQTELIKLEQLAASARVDNPEKATEYKDQINKLKEDISLINEPLEAYKVQNDYTENIGAYIDRMMIDGRIKKNDEKLVHDILTARFNEHGTTGIVNAYKNLSFIDTLGSPINALTQIADLAWAMYAGKVWTPRGFVSTVTNLSKAVMNKSDITKEDLGIERIAQEFSDGTTLSKAVNKVFKLIGLEKLDSIGKEVLINNALDQYKFEAKNNPEALAKKIRPTFGNDSMSVVQDLLADNPSDNVKMLLYSRSLDFQPIGLSEMPEFYLNGGNGRVFYMLKTYTIKQLDMFRREVVHNIKSDDPKQRLQGIVNMIQLMTLLTLANAGVDELKDFMLNKEGRFSDHVMENFLTLGGASRYMKMQVSKEGFGSAMAQQILPPMKFMNSASKDLNEAYTKYVAGDTNKFDNARIIDSIPGLGKLYYWHFGRGFENKKSLAAQDFIQATKDANLFKKQLGNSIDKRTFIESNLDRFKQMKLHDNFQGALNRNEAVINKLKKLPVTANVETRLGQLKQQREQILNKYVEVAKGMQ